MAAADSAGKRTQKARQLVQANDEVGILTLLHTEDPAQWPWPELQHLMQESARLGFVAVLQALKAKAKKYVHGDLVDQALLYGASYKQLPVIRELLSWEGRQRAPCSREGAHRCRSKVVLKTSEVGQLPHKKRHRRQGYQAHLPCAAGKLHMYSKLLRESLLGTTTLNANKALHRRDKRRGLVPT